MHCSAESVGFPSRLPPRRVYSRGSFCVSSFVRNEVPSLSETFFYALAFLSVIFQTLDTLLSFHVATPVPSTREARTKSSLGHCLSPRMSPCVDMSMWPFRSRLSLETPQVCGLGAGVPEAVDVSGCVSAAKVCGYVRVRL